jgi:hypothetical protein
MSCELSPSDLNFSLSLSDIVKLLNLYKGEHFERKKIYNGSSFINRPFPSDISENLVLNFIEKVEKRKCQWTIHANHDLYLPTTDRKIEVKAFSNTNQIVTFTCTQTFDLLYVVDGHKFELDKYVIHIFEFSSEQMKSMSVGMDATPVKSLNDDKRSVRTTLKRLLAFAQEKNYYHEDYKMHLSTVSTLTQI